MRGLGVPRPLQLPFRPRGMVWDDEADLQAEKDLLALVADDIDSR